MEDSIIESICNSCNCSELQAKEYLQDEIQNLEDLRDLNDLRYEDFITACENLGVENDYTIFFINALTF